MSYFDDDGEGVYQEEIEIDVGAAVKTEDSHPFAHMAKGRTLGKSIVVPCPASASSVLFSGNMLEIKGSDEDASQLCLTLAEPKIIPGALLLGASSTGEQDNSGFSICPGNLLAVVQWGIGGVASQAEVDFMNGCQVNLQASWLRVGVLYERVVAQDFTAVLRAFVGPGNAKPNNAQRSINIGQIAASGSSGIFPVPRFSKAATVAFRQTGGTPDPAVEFYRDAAGAQPVMRLEYEPTINPAPNYNFPANLCNGCYFFRFVNESVSIMEQVSVVFELSI